jgi:hypothetical protein
MTGRSHCAWSKDLFRCQESITLSVLGQELWVHTGATLSVQLGILDSVFIFILFFCTAWLASEEGGLISGLC